MPWLVWLAGLATDISRFGRRRRAPLQAGATLLALGLGLWGWTVHRPPEGIEGWLSNLFRTFQLVTLVFPPQAEADIPLQLQIARLAVPVVAAIATFNILVGSITRPVRLALLPWTRGHIVVVGPAQLTEAALKLLAERGEQVVALTPQLGEARRDDYEAVGLTVVDAEPLRPGGFDKVNLGRAAALFLLEEDDVANLNLAMAAFDAMEKRLPGLPPLTVAVMVEDEDLATELDLALDRLSRRHGVLYRRILPERESLALELARFAPVRLKAERDKPSHAVVFGLAGAWRQTLLQLVVAMQDHPALAPALSLVIDEAQEAQLAVWRAAHPDLALVVDIHVLRREGEQPPADADVAAWRAATPAPDLAVVLEPDARGLATAFRLRRAGSAFGLEHAPALVRQTTEDRLLGRLDRIDLPHWDGANLVPFGGLVRADSIARVLDPTRDARAIALHEAYARANPATAVGAQVWEELPENMRDANRGAADHLPIMLAFLGLALPEPGAPAGLAIGPEAIEPLARIEHRRWCAERIARGWRHGPQRDDARRLHPLLVPFDDLEDSDREKDRQAVIANLRAVGVAVGG